jgi:excinuclease ABC subunit A
VVKEGIDRRLADSIEAALKMGKGLVTLSFQAPDKEEYEDKLFSESYSCPICGFSMPELEPRMFSFNSPYGACPECTGLGTKTEFDPELIVPDSKRPLRDGAIAPFVYKSGETKDWWPDMLDAVGRAAGFDSNTPIGQLSEEALKAVWYGVDKRITVHMHYGRHVRKFETQWDGVLAALKKRYDTTESEWVKRDLEQYMSTKPCPVCHGKRLKPETLAVKVGKLSISEVAAMPVEESVKFFQALPAKLNKRQMAIAERAVKEILERLRFLFDVGLAYLTLDRNARTLAGGEAQRIRLATQIGSGLMGCLYILDEPSIGLHQRDNRKLIETLQRLRDLGNTVLVVEHDEETMLAADWLIDLGPGAGEHGGKIVAEGPPEEFLKTGCITAWPKADRDPSRPPSSNQRLDRGSERAWTQPEEREREVPKGALHMRYGRERLGQEHPHPGHSVPSADVRRVRHERRMGAPRRRHRHRHL